jgi:hypothetical protein
MSKATSVAFSEDDTLYRRLAPDHVSGDRVNSLAYSKETPYEKSVDLARLTTPDQTVATRPNFGLGEISVGAVWELGIEVRHDPMPGNAAHCVIVGEYSRHIARQLAIHTKLIRRPQTALSDEIAKLD